ncbi:MAG: GNAT family N-acetyltransferase [Anaerolineales bacterium]
MDELFESHTLNLRPFEASYSTALQAYLNHPDLAGRRYLPWGYPDYTPLSESQVAEVIQEWIQARKSLHLAVYENKSTDLVGHAELDWEWDPHCPSLALVIATLYQRRGYGTQVLALLLRYAFEFTPAHTVTVWINDWNQPAVAFFESQGFKSAGRMRRTAIHLDSYCDLLVMDLLRQEWRESQGGQDGA